MSFSKLAYFLRRTRQSIQQSPVVQTVAISTIAIAVTVLGAFLLLLRNLDHLADRWAAEARLVAFLAEDAGPSQLALAQSEVARWPEVEEVTSLTRPEALSSFRKALGRDAALLDGIDPALIPASLTLRLRPEARDPAVMEGLAARLSSLPGLGAVEKLDHGQDLVGRFRDFQGLLGLAGGVLATLVAFAVVFIISNTVRLTLYARQQELEIMQLVGATDAFIRAPVYLEGAFQGLLGAGLAVALLGLAHRLLLGGAPVLRFGQLEVPLSFLSWPTAVGLVLGAGLVGVLAAHLASGRFLKGTIG
jgi:cell division transport system permease protein